MITNSKRYTLNELTNVIFPDNPGNASMNTLERFRHNFVHQYGMADDSDNNSDEDCYDYEYVDEELKHHVLIIIRDCMPHLFGPNNHAGQRIDSDGEWIEDEASRLHDENLLLSEFKQFVKVTMKR